MLATGRARVPMATEAARSDPLVSGSPCVIVASASRMPRAERYASPEWTAIAANRSGCVAASVAAIAPPAEKPATNTRRTSIVP